MCVFTKANEFLSGIGKDEEETRREDQGQRGARRAETTDV